MRVSSNELFSTLKNMMNKCAKFHKDSQRDKIVKFNLPNAVELSETAVFEYNFV